MLPPRRGLNSAWGTVARTSYSAVAPMASRSPSLQFILEQMQHRVETQDAQIVTLDAKANFNLTAATVLAAGLASYAANLLAFKLNDFTSIRGAAIVFSILLYLALILSVWQAHRVRVFLHAPEPQDLINYVDKPLDKTHFDLADGMRYSLQVNQLEVEKKADWVIRSERLLLIEAVWIALIFVWRLLT